MTTKAMPLNLAAGLSAKILAQIEELPCFKGVPTTRLCHVAMSKMRGHRVIECRITAMVIIVGNAPLTDEVFQLTPTAQELGG
jgi:hypothetical protein